MFAIGFVLIDTHNHFELIPNIMIGRVLLVVSAFIALATAWDYFKAALPHIIDNKPEYLWNLYLPLLGITTQSGIKNAQLFVEY